MLTALLLVSTIAAASPKPVSPRISALSDRLSKHERGAEGEFWAQIAKDGGPIVEPNDADKLLVTFL